MASVIILAISLALSSVTFTAAIPVPSEGGTESSNRTFSVTQSHSLEQTVGVNPSSSAWIPNACISIENPELPTKVALGSTAGTIPRLVGYSDVCNFAEVPTSPPSTTRNFTEGILVVNQRQPICSFKVVNILPGNKIDVKFLGQFVKDDQKFYKTAVADNSCFDMCASSFWDPYVISVKILEYGSENMAGNSIRIFTGTGGHKCEGEIAQETVIGDGANLARLTLVEPEHFVKSFTIVNFYV